jgi:hypothetical protein
MQWVRFERDAMTETSIEELQAEIRRLRDLVTLLSVVLLRNGALDGLQSRVPAITVNADQLLREAEECFRCAKLPGLRAEIAEGLQVAGHELMARAVAIETASQRMARKDQL